MPKYRLPRHFVPRNDKSGFTLIELLVVISIIAILSAVGFVSYQGVRGKAIETRRKADIDSIKKAYEVKYDASLFGGQGGYKPILASDFVSAKIPTPDSTLPISSTNTYIVKGTYEIPGQPTPSEAPNFAVAVNLNTGASCTSENEPGCYIAKSNQGPPVETFSIGNAVLNGSFETDSNGDGLADNWTIYRGVNSVALVSSPSPIDGRFIQKVVVNSCCFAGIFQTITGLKPSTTYKQTGWMYMESGHGACGSVGVGMQGAGGETFVGCDRRDQWVQLTLTGNSDASGNYYTGFQNWSDNAYFYVDSVRVEEVK